MAATRRYAPFHRNQKLDPLKVAQAKQLLAIGTPPVEICRRLRLSEGSLRRIEAGQVRVEDRCPGCGGLQSQPCLVCRDRKALGLTA